MARKNKLEEEAISKILVADTDSESGVEARGGWGGEVGGGGEEEEGEEAGEAAAAITNTGQCNPQPNCAALCVLLMAIERAHNE
jgi:hypothetical protein